MKSLSIMIPRNILTLGRLRSRSAVDVARRRRLTIDAIDILFISVAYHIPYFLSLMFINNWLIFHNMNPLTLCYTVTFENSLLLCHVPELLFSISYSYDATLTVRVNVGKCIASAWKLYHIRNLYVLHYFKSSNFITRL